MESVGIGVGVCSSSEFGVWRLETRKPETWSSGRLDKIRNACRMCPMRMWGGMNGTRNTSHPVQSTLACAPDKTFLLVSMLL